MVKKLINILTMPFLKVGENKVIDFLYSEWSIKIADLGRLSGVSPY